MSAGRKIFKISGGIALSLFLLWLAGLSFFCNKAEKFPVPGSDIRTDAIVVLTGGADRINTGLDLLHAGSAEKLLISGVDERVTLEKITSLWNGHMDDPGCCIFLGHMARNTKENAEETRQWAEQMYVHSIRLVTSSYHMPRAIIEFHRAMPDIKILPHPVFPNSTDGGSGKRLLFALMIQEYNKAILSKARSFFATGQGA